MYTYIYIYSIVHICKSFQSFKYNNIHNGKGSITQQGAQRTKSGPEALEVPSVKWSILHAALTWCDMIWVDWMDCSWIFEVLLLVGFSRLWHHATARQPSVMDVSVLQSLCLIWELLIVPTPLNRKSAQSITLCDRKNEAPNHCLRQEIPLVVYQSVWYHHFHHENCGFGWTSVDCIHWPAHLVAKFSFLAWKWLPIKLQHLLPCPVVVEAVVEEPAGVFG